MGRAASACSMAEIPSALRRVGSDAASGSASSGGGRNGDAAHGSDPPRAVPPTGASAGHRPESPRPPRAGPVRRCRPRIDRHPGSVGVAEQAVHVARAGSPGRRAGSPRPRDSGGRRPRSLSIARSRPTVWSRSRTARPAACCRQPAPANAVRASARSAGCAERTQHDPRNDVPAGIAEVERTGGGGRSPAEPGETGRRANREALPLQR